MESRVSFLNRESVQTIFITISVLLVMILIGSTAFAGYTEDDIGIDAKDLAKDELGLVWSHPTNKISQYDILVIDTIDTLHLIQPPKFDYLLYADVF